MAAFGSGGRKRKSNRELARNLLDISVSVKEAANGLLDGAVQKEDIDTLEPDSVSAVALRAEKLRKRAFSSSNPKVSKKSTSSRSSGSKCDAGRVSISVCKMKMNSRGLYQRDGAFRECELERSYSYDTVIEVASNFLKMNGASVRLHLYRPRGGVLIVPRDIILNDAAVPWTLGSYMQMKHIGPDAVQLGVGPASEVCLDKNSFELEVWYGKLVGHQVASILDRVERCTIMEELDIQQSMFQPEDYDYIVTYIAEEGLPLYNIPVHMKSLTSTDFLMARGYKEGNDLSIIYQSPESIVCQGCEEVSLYCIVNILSIETRYNWHASNEPTLLASTPVLYVNKPGMYFCTVRYKGTEVRSRPTELSMVPGSPVSIRSSVTTASVLSGAKSCDNSVSSGVEFSLTELLEATGQKQQENLLGKGGYGSVYRGVLHHTTVAVKFLNEEGASSLGNRALGAEMLKTELAALTKFRHPNIVSIMGYSFDKEVVVYEYISGGSLFQRLHEVIGRVYLSWIDRLNILKDTCRGLLYLHTVDKPIVHQDIKSQNILITDGNRAKITDFGFALELPTVHDNRSLYTAKAFARSEGYYPGELTTGKFSPKSDVYSYGVVVLETFTAQRVFDAKRSDPKLVDHMEDDLKSIEAFKECQDKNLELCSSVWITFLYKLIKDTLSRHSKRPTSMQVMQAWENLQFS